MRHVWRKYEDRTGPHHCSTVVRHYGDPASCNHEPYAYRRVLMIGLTGSGREMKQVQARITVHHGRHQNAVAAAIDVVQSTRPLHRPTDLKQAAMCVVRHDDTAATVDSGWIREHGETCTRERKRSVGDGKYRRVKDHCERSTESIVLSGVADP